MVVYFFTKQIAVCEKIIDKITKIGLYAIPHYGQKFFFHILHKKSTLPDLFVMDYTMFQHDMLNIYKYMRELNVIVPLIFYNDPYPPDEQRVTYWLFQLARHFTELKISPEIKQLLYAIQSAVESPDIKPYIPLIQKPLPFGEADICSQIQKTPVLPYNLNIFDIRKKTKMPPTIFNLFTKLVSRYNTFITKNELKSEILMHNRVASDTSVGVYISRLRNCLRKIKKYNIEIVHARGGYKLIIY